jgi:Glyoxalase-like domain
MTHYSRLSKIAIDVPPAEHDRELAFWSSALGQPLTRFDSHPNTTAPRSTAQNSGCLSSGSVTARAGVHLDIHTNDLAAESARLEELGAERVQQVHQRPRVATGPDRRVLGHL